MWVSLVRHGEAGYAADDRARTLTDKGVRDATEVGVYLARLGLEHHAPPSVVLHSPYTRTQQPAELLAGQCGAIPLIAESALIPEGTVDAVDALLDRCAQDATEHVILVSHQPLVSYIHAYFLGQDHTVPPMIPAAVTTFSLDTIGPQLGSLLYWAVPGQYEPNRR